MPFDRPTLETLIDRAAADVESRLPGVDARLRRSNAQVLARVHSGAIHGVYGYIDFLSRQLLPDTSEIEFLERQASIWGLGRKSAVQATGTVTLTGTDGSHVPAGTELQRSDGARFTTAATVTIQSGSATATVTAADAGIDGDTAAAATLTLISPIAGVQSAATVATAIAGGTDVESDEALRSRLIARIQEPPHGGADFDYVAWALEVAGVTRAWVFPLELGLGTVTVRFVVDDDPVSLIPDAAKVAEVQAHIDAVRPVTAAPTVVAPVAAPFDVTIANLDPDTAEVRAAIEAEIADLLRREAIPGGTILISHLREAVSVAAGENDSAVTSPAADVTHTAGQIPVMGTVTFT